MTRGTKSILFGAHQFIIHPLFVAAAWTKLYGFPRDYRLWVAFFVHDLGYIGCKEMDDEKGEEHPFLGGRIMKRLFGKHWEWFTVSHSRFIVKRWNQSPSAVYHGQRQFSRLCVADKLAGALEPEWLYLPRVWLSGELKEYMQNAQKAYEGQGKYAGERTRPVLSAQDWFRGFKQWSFDWVEANKRLGTPEPK